MITYFVHSLIKNLIVNNPGSKESIHMSLGSNDQELSTSVFHPFAPIHNNIDEIR